MSKDSHPLADHFASLAVSHGTRFVAPHDTAPDWLPTGYVLVTDPEHLCQPDDCVRPFLGNDWRLLSSINGGNRCGKKAKDVGAGILYVATKDRCVEGDVQKC